MAFIWSQPISNWATGTNWVGVHSDETCVRGTGHGFLAWAPATMLVVPVLGSVYTSGGNTYRLAERSSS
ncbi:hypothetical protein CHELA1G11_21186 [Hyphomicrobiales bacterium]|nr:hypothetical protein CHELA1G11_21186 [Hyphomicrobiales bacterium]CAH1693669.1 hypothetical protein CHELA1G2_21493 [Hyphomicrobiales bacterium]